MFVSTRGARRVLVEWWLPPRRWELHPGLAVSRDGDKVVVDTARFGVGQPTYVDTRVPKLPSDRGLRAGRPLVARSGGAIISASRRIS